MATASRKWVINARQDILAIDDLMEFAINARRLIENTTSPEHFLHVTIKAAMAQRDGTAGNAGQTRITRILNALVHHKDLHIVRFNFKKPENDDIASIMEIYKLENITYSEPMIMLTTDRGQRIGFRLKELILTFETEVLNPILDFCADQDLDLEDAESHAQTRLG
jgi:hypothetical protein